MSNLFPLSFMLNTFAMTALLIGLSLAKESQMAADVGIVQGATLALFFAFSANARNMILNTSARISVPAILVARLLLLVPLGVLSFYLSVGMADVEWSLALVFICRRCVEWIGELHLSEMELQGRSGFAGKFFALQSILLILVLGWTLGHAPMPLLGLFLWALLPLLMSLGFVREHLTGAGRFAEAWPRMIPHLGSTAMIGVSVYVFRLLILLIVGKATAGDLYAAFAIGGILGAMFSNALGPSLVFQEARNGKQSFPATLKLSMFLWFVAGVVIFLAVKFSVGVLSWMGKSDLFWGAVGLSMIGGVVMVFAQRIRLRLLQLHGDRDVFGPDVIMNILVVAAVPYLYYLVGLKALTTLYLLSSVLALLFYLSSERRIALGDQRFGLSANVLRRLIALLLFFPLFFQLTGNIFYDSSFVFASEGALKRLPIPLSVFACYGGILLLGGYKRAYLSLGFIFLSFILMLMASVVSAHGQIAEQQGKLLLLLQYVLPMFGLVLGMMYEDGRQNEHVVEKAMLLVIAALMPAQLLASWAQAQMLLTPYLYLFSIYQHLQYVPVIVAGSYLVALFSLWNYRTWRMLILALAPLVGIYVAASGSMLTGGFAVAGCAALAVHRMTIDKYRGRRIPEWAVFSLVLGTGTAYHFWSSWTTKFMGVGGQAGSGWAGMYTQKFAGSTMVNIQSRFDAWRYYLRGIFSDPATFLLGHNVPPDRKIWPSAHNYYLDFIYNFGFIAALVIIGLVVFTIIQLYQNRMHILMSPAMLGLTIVVLFLLIPDSLMKVGMRQPYPGIITFFLWGLLLARIESLRTADERRLPAARAQ